MDNIPTCAHCTKAVCMSEFSDRGPENCPTRTEQDIIQKAATEYQKPDVYEFARQASVQESEGYLHLPAGRTPVTPRVEEVIGFAKKMGYKKLGVAFCTGLASEAETFLTILENRGFETVSVRCKVGGVPKETIGITQEQKINGPGKWETMCNPIVQAMLMNQEGTDFNIVMGLCVGHDSLFFKYAKAPTTVLIAKDRVLGHNPAAALYLSGSFYRKLMRKET